ncbi:MAG: sigma-70 family RNA polymerase sigma factor [Actinomycetota bacterium]|nr:sigma-70 family RNA polymerase sigma factor [Actinomycetota bacterium]
MARGEGKIVSLLGYRRGDSTKVSESSDEALLALIGQGNEQALAELYRRLGRVAYGVAYRIVRDEALAQDVVQEAFLSVWRAAAGFLAERSKPSTWVLTLVHRRAVDLVRREERRRADSLELDPDVPADEGLDLAEDVVRRRVVRDALRQLPGEQREALELAYFGGYTQSELAERLGQPLGTIKSRMFSGLARMREVLGAEALEHATRR